MSKFNEIEYNEWEKSIDKHFEYLKNNAKEEILRLKSVLEDAGYEVQLIPRYGYTYTYIDVNNVLCQKVIKTLSMKFVNIMDAFRNICVDSQGNTAKKIFIAGVFKEDCNRLYYATL